VSRHTRQQHHKGFAKIQRSFADTQCSTHSLADNIGLFGGKSRFFLRKKKHSFAKYKKYQLPFAEMQGCADVQGSTCTIIFAFQNRHVSLVKEPYFHGALWQKRPGLQSHHDPKFSLSMYFCKKALHFCKRALHSRKRALHLRKSINQSHHQPIISLSICFRKRALHLRKRVLHLRTRAR